MHNMHAHTPSHSVCMHALLMHTSPCCASTRYTCSCAHAHTHCVSVLRRNAWMLTLRGGHPTHYAVQRCVALHGFPMWGDGAQHVCRTTTLRMLCIVSFYPTIYLPILYTFLYPMCRGREEKREDKKKNNKIKYADIQRGGGLFCLTAKQARTACVAVPPLSLYIYTCSYPHPTLPLWVWGISWYFPWNRHIPPSWGPALPPL